MKYNMINNTNLKNDKIEIVRILLVICINLFINEVSLKICHTNFLKISYSYICFSMKYFVFIVKRIRQFAFVAPSSQIHFFHITF